MDESLTLALSAADASIGPRIPPTNSFATGEAPETQVRAAVFGGTAGTDVVVNLEISDFDVAPGGHVGHTPPLPPATIVRNPPGRSETGRGDLVGGSDVLTSSCTLTLEDHDADESTPAMGACEVTYKAGIVSGSATIRGKIDGSDPLVEDEAEVAVRVALVPVAALFPRAGERHRGAGTAGFHPDATAYWVDPRAVARVLLLQTLWEHLTRSPATRTGRTSPSTT